MRYALETSNGVELRVGSTPLPSGSIEPIPNWDAIVGIPPGYLKVVGGDTIEEKSQAEKDAWDAAHPPTLEELQEIAELYLRDTDWYSVREYETGKDTPVAVRNERIQQRLILGESNGS